jgi:hypothetical protein
MKTGFLTPLVAKEVDGVVRLTGNGRWRLVEPLTYHSKALNRTITVPANFCTDFATVPRLPLAWLIAGGVGNAPAVIHDFLWRHGNKMGISRSIANLVFLEALRSTGVPSWRACLMHLAVVILDILKR